ncbi:hypothetical protein GCM10010435_87310 [Winogradskya consettensis]|uniref:Uncharacterized protein n=1 Tax=Winogradskya consettensis TaxID=113560 RepID=A0A919T0S8_9ACTN|nr:hypothetical protein Aco04nite_73120 [Actinoplanes consettensis]
MIPFNRNTAAITTTTAVTTHEYGSSQFSSDANRRRTISGTPRTPAAASGAPTSAAVPVSAAATSVTPRS